MIMEPCRRRARARSVTICCFRCPLAVVARAMLADDVEKLRPAVHHAMRRASCATVDELSVRGLDELLQYKLENIALGEGSNTGGLVFADAVSVGRDLTHARQSAAREQSAMGRVDPPRFTIRGGSVSSPVVLARVFGRSYEHEEPQRRVGARGHAFLERRRRAQRGVGEREHPRFDATAMEHARVDHGKREGRRARTRKRCVSEQALGICRVDLEALFEKEHVVDRAEQALQRSR